MLDDVAMVMAMMVHPAAAATCVRISQVGTDVDAELSQRSAPATGGVL